MFWTATDDYPLWPNYMTYTDANPIVGYQARTITAEVDVEDDDDDDLSALLQLYWLLVVFFSLN